MCALLENPVHGGRRFGLSGCQPARRQGAAGMGRDPPRRRIMTISRYLYGPLTWLGVAVALLTAALDQASKLWLLFGYDLASRGTVRLAPVLDLVLVWNTGISYGL